MAENATGVRRFYRIVTSIPPTLEDFTSRAARGKPPHSDDPRILRLEEGISVFVTLAQARAVARRFPVLGGSIAEIVIPDGFPVNIERTGGKGHHTIWGDPADIQRWVTSIYPVA